MFGRKKTTYKVVVTILWKCWMRFLSFFLSLGGVFAYFSVLLWGLISLEISSVSLVKIVAGGGPDMWHCGRAGDVWQFWGQFWGWNIRIPAGTGDVFHSPGRWEAYHLGKKHISKSAQRDMDDDFCFEELLCWMVFFVGQISPSGFTMIRRYSKTTRRFFSRPQFPRGGDMQDTSMQTHALCQMLIRPTKRDMTWTSRLKTTCCHFFIFSLMGMMMMMKPVSFQFVASMSGLEQIFVWHVHPPRNWIQMVGSWNQRTQ